MVALRLYRCAPAPRAPLLPTPLSCLVEEVSFRVLVHVHASNRNAILTYEHQKEALAVLTRCHPMLMNDLCDIFDLRSAPEKDKVILIQTLKSSGRMNKAVTYTWKLGLQKHFDMAEVCTVLCLCVIMYTSKSI